MKRQMEIMFAKFHIHQFSRILRLIMYCAARLSDVVVASPHGTLLLVCVFRSQAITKVLRAVAEAIHVAWLSVTRDTFSSLCCSLPRRQLKNPYTEMMM